MADSLSSGDANAAETGMHAVPGKHLTFLLDDEVYGLEILKVQEIIGLMPVTRVPNTPRFVRGIINLRGKVIPVVDLRISFGMEGEEDTDRTCIIVVQVEQEGSQIVMGVLVDEVSEVLDITADQIEPPPSFGASIDTSFLLGTGKVGDKVILLLEVDRVLAHGDLALTSEVASAV